MGICNGTDRIDSSMTVGRTINPKRRNGSSRQAFCPLIAVFTILILTAFYPAYPEVLLFPAPPKTLSAETMPYSQMLHTGVENDTFCMRGRFGVDFPVIGYDFGDNGYPRNVLFGITAAAHINMRPKDDQSFPVDNFYAVLGLHFSGLYGSKLSWRLYPIYHVSAHLADGFPADIIKRDVRSVSSEMIRGELYYKPFGEILELGAGGGWYYHVCSQKDLRYKGGASILFTPKVNMLDDMLNPYILIRGENVFQSGHNPGIEASAGMMALKNRRGMGISLRYFNHLHSSYYYKQYEKGWGSEYMFMF